jgi:TfoX N-terminal domain
VPYNEALAEKVRRALTGTEGLTEKKMFGGIAFLVDGAMCIGVNQDDLIVRCAKDETEALLAKKGVREFDLSGGRPMKGWVLVGPEATATAAGFNGWLEFARRGAQAQPVTRSSKSAPKARADSGRRDAGRGGRGRP